MLEDDKIETIIEMECGCILSHKHYYNSGFQQDTAQAHLKYRYNLEINKDNIKSFFEQNEEGYKKLLNGIEIKKLCVIHTDKLLMNIIAETVVYYLKK